MSCFYITTIFESNYSIIKAQLKYYRNANSQQNPSLGNNNNPTAQKMGDKIVSRNIYSGRNRNGIAVAKLNQTGGNIVDGKFVSHV